MNNKGFQAIFGGVDLNTKRQTGNLFGTVIPGGADVRWKNPICPDHEFSPMEHIQYSIKGSNLVLCYCEVYVSCFQHDPSFTN